MSKETIAVSTLTNAEVVALTHSTDRWTKFVAEHELERRSLTVGRLVNILFPTTRKG